MTYQFGSIALISLLALSACGGSSGGSSLHSNPFVLGPGAEGSGLPFAAAGTAEDLSNLGAGDSMKVMLVRYQNVQGEDTMEIISSEETVTLVDDGAGGFDAEMTFNGETVTFTLISTDPINGVGTLASGSDISINQLRGATSSRAIGIYSYEFAKGTPVDGGLNTEGQFVVGYVTDPATIEMQTGAARYAATFSGFGGVIDSNAVGVQHGGSLDGEIVFEVSFDDQTISSSIPSGAHTNFGNFTGTMEKQDISSGQFTGDIDITCASFDCTSNSQIGGRFFGPEGEELSGMIMFDVTATDTAMNRTIQTLTPAGFVATQPLP